MGKSKYVWVRTEDLPAGIQGALQAFQSCFWRDLASCKITYFREDAVFIQYEGMLHAYSVASFCQRNPKIYIEIEAVAPRLFNIRLFFSEWIARNEIPRHLEFMGDEKRDVDLPSSIMCERSEAWRIPAFSPRPEAGQTREDTNTTPRDLL